MSKGENLSKNSQGKDSDYKRAYEKWVKEVLEPALAKHPERSKNCAKSSFSVKIIYELPYF